MLKLLKEALNDTISFKGNVIHICKRQPSVILILPSFTFIFKLSHLKMALLRAETCSG
jgi:hypothetical protein